MISVVFVKASFAAPAAARTALETAFAATDASNEVRGIVGNDGVAFVAAAEPCPTRSRTAFIAFPTMLRHIESTVGGLFSV